MYSKRQGIIDATSAIKEYDCQISDLKNELRKTNDLILNIVEDRNKTRQQLASGLLISNSKESVDHVALEIGAMHLTEKLNELLLQLEKNRKLLEKTVNLEIYINRDAYIHPVGGKLTKEIAENNLLLENIKNSINGLESAPYFKWVKKYLNAKPGLVTSLKSFFTFSFIYKNKRLRMCEDKLGNLSEAIKAHDGFLSHNIETESYIKELEQQKKPIIEAMELVNSLEGRIERFDVDSLNILREMIADHFNDCDLRLILPSIREDAKILLSKLDALRNKEKHLNDIKSHIGSEIQDRQQRNNKINNVLNKWKRSSKHYLSSDKSKWLIDTPKNSRRRTNRFTESYSDNRTHIHNYNDYNGYSAAFCTGVMFSSFAVLASECNVDNYVANEVFSENSEMAALASSGEALLEGSALESIVEMSEFEIDMSENEALDDFDAS